MQELSYWPNLKLDPEIKIKGRLLNFTPKQSVCVWDNLQSKGMEYVYSLLQQLDGSLPQFLQDQDVSTIQVLATAVTLGVISLLFKFLGNSAVESPIAYNVQTPDAAIPGWKGEILDNPSIKVSHWVRKLVWRTQLIRLFKDLRPEWHLMLLSSDWPKARDCQSS